MSLEKINFADQVEAFEKDKDPVLGFYNANEWCNNYVSIVKTADDKYEIKPKTDINQETLKQHKDTVKKLVGEVNYDQNCGYLINGLYIGHLVNLVSNYIFWKQRNIEEELVKLPNIADGESATKQERTRRKALDNKWEILEGDLELINAGRAFMESSEFLQEEERANVDNALEIVRYHLEKLRPKEWEVLLRFHAEQVLGSEMELQSGNLHEMVAWYSDSLRQFLTRENVVLAEDNINRKLSMVRIHVLDPLKMAYWGATEDVELYGLYDIKTHTIYIRFEGLIDSTNFRTVFSHELNHAVSGCTANNKSGDIEMVRNGLRFETDKRVDEKESRTSEDLGYTGRFFWLDEAITEYVANVIAGSSLDEISYVSQRRLWHMLCNKGTYTIPKKLFLEAYFEDYDPGKLERWNALRRAIDLAYCPGFMLALDKYSRMFGTLAAIEVMNRDWRKIVSVMNGTKEEQEKHRLAMRRNVRRKIKLENESGDENNFGGILSMFKGNQVEYHY